MPFEGRLAPEQLAPARFGRCALIAEAAAARDQPAKRVEGVVAIRRRAAAEERDELTARSQDAQNLGRDLLDVVEEHEREMARDDVKALVGERHLLGTAHDDIGCAGELFEGHIEADGSGYRTVAAREIENMGAQVAGRSNLGRATNIDIATSIDIADIATNIERATNIGRATNIERATSIGRATNIGHDMKLGTATHSNSCRGRARGELLVGPTATEHARRDPRIPRVKPTQPRLAFAHSTMLTAHELRARVAADRMADAQ